MMQHLNRFGLYLHNDLFRDVWFRWRMNYFLAGFFQDDVIGQISTIVLHFALGEVVLDSFIVDGTAFWLGERHLLLNLIAGEVRIESSPVG